MEEDELPKENAKEIETLFSLFHALAESGQINNKNTGDLAKAFKTLINKLDASFLRAETAINGMQQRTEYIVTAMNVLEGRISQLEQGESFLPPKPDESHGYDA